MTAWLTLALLASPALADGPRIDVNAAGHGELTRLPGVGKAIAQRILDSRHAEGPFASVDDLRRIKGIGARTLDKLRPLVTVGGPPTGAPGGPPPPRKIQGDASPPRAPPRAVREIRARINLNTATQKELQALPGVGPKTAASIVSDRNDRGPFGAVDDLTRVRGIGKGKLAKIRPFVAVADPPPKTP